MYGLLMRGIVALCGIAIVLMLGARALGQQVNEFPGLTISRKLDDGRDVVYIDHQTRSRFTIRQRDDSQLYVSPDGKFSFDTEIVDEQLHLYLKPTNGAEAYLLGVYDFVAERELIAWSADSESLFVSRNGSENTIDLMKIAISDGTVALFESYNLDFVPVSMFMLGSNHLVMVRRDYFAAVDLTTHESHSYPAMSYPRISSDERFVAFGASTDNPDEGIVTIVDLDTFQETHLSANNPSWLILWSQGAPMLTFVDGDHVVIYDAATETRHDLSSEYQLPQAMLGIWSYDGTRLFLTKQLDDESIAYLAVNFQTGEETPFVVDDLSSARPYTLIWSQDDQYVLAYTNALGKFLKYRIYDGQTGALFYDIDTDPESKIKTQFIDWLQY